MSVHEIRLLSTMLIIIIIIILLTTQNQLVFIIYTININNFVNF